MSARRRLIVVSVALALVAAWALVAFWIGPAEISRAHRGESLPFVNDQLAGRAEIPLDEYLADWRRLVTRLGWMLGAVVVIGVAALEFLASAPGRRFRDAVRDRFERATQREAGWPFASVVWFAVGIGLTTGVIEAAWGVVEQRHLPAPRLRMFAHGWEALWMVPVVNTLFLGLLALALHLPRLRWRTLVLDRFVLFSLAAPAVFVLVRRILPGMHHVAALLLAAGLAAQLARRLASHPGRWRPFVKRSTAWLALGLAAWTVVAQGARWITERRQLAALGPAAEGSPNVLLLVLDTVRARNLGLYGYERPTSPSIDSVGALGVVFENAVATAPWTLPSHASMFTGRWAHELSTDWERRLDDTYPTLAEWFVGHGYATVAFVANTGYGSPSFGLQRGFIHYDARPNSLELVLASSWLGHRTLRMVRDRIWKDRRAFARVRASEVREEFLGWLASGSASAGDAPFFAFLNLFDAHDPYRPEPPYAERFARPGARYWLGPTGVEYTERQQRDLLDTYDGSLAYLDEEVGLLLRELSRSGVLDNTIVVITSDHGEEFGEHGVWKHGRSLYLPSLHVPLLVVWPGRVPAGHRVQALVSLRDLPATLVHLVSGEDDGGFPGASLARLWMAPEGPGAEGAGRQAGDTVRAGPSATAGTASDRSPSRRLAPLLLAEVSGRPGLPSTVPAGRGDLESIFMDGLHYIRVADGGEELYDVFADPWELDDLTGTERGRAAMRRLAAALAAAIR